ncbi:MAG: glycosyltransferase family 2 protein, partial [Verrucomicrobia bacterium]|nr:glycosyltransferase family 2 protein [Verrucomicrobiota bacterium]
MNNTPEISIVIPVFNEEDCLTNLIYRLLAVMQETGRDYELIFVNDGSTDRTSELLNAFYEDHPDKVTLIEFNGNYGQYTAICAGFEQVRGIKVVTLDADLQNPPEEIPKLLQKMDEGHDYVGGIRCKRKDNLMRRWCSKAINSIREKTTQIKITDQGCMMRAYSRSIVDAIAQAQEKSVFISALAYKYASNPAE